MSVPTVDGWVRCPPGELGRLGTRLRRRRLFRLGLGAAAVVLVVVVLGAMAVQAAASLAQSWAEPIPDPPSCHPTPATAE